MGGEGAMMAMITSLRNNNRRKNRTRFDKDKLGGYDDGQKIEFDFPEVTPEVLIKIRDRLQNERMVLLWKRKIIFAIILTGLLIFILY